MRNVEKLDRPERPDFCIGRTGGGLVDQRFRAVRDVLKTRCERSDNGSEIVRARLWKSRETPFGRTVDGTFESANL